MTFIDLERSITWSSKASSNPDAIKLGISGRLGEEARVLLNVWMFDCLWRLWKGITP